MEAAISAAARAWESPGHRGAPISCGRSRGRSVDCTELDALVTGQMGKPLAEAAAEIEKSARSGLVRRPCRAAADLAGNAAPP
ncbi:hypothetical protein GCM10023215_00400 [Pseudonocardia yuanmonensis]|uniref:Uncharacterized protein n=1 Tax=Pseudonocardia yuanmonensis TaxID=1095914 RepID=A0ABP8VV23_9PSEU